ncbi:hypothetical protein [Bacillus litorisediminis]|uniref:hypothetical protein n=1 Tax=Bacillus litorisediminis TaxID=2922713 RepID=UPI001FABAD9A|nr:hypothetical protein [Bacillus litorisediminis]
MKVKFFITIFTLGIMCTVYFVFFSSSNSYSERLCNQIEKVDSECSDIYLVDSNSNIVFYKNESKLMFAQTNDDLTEIKTISGSLSLKWMFDSDEPLLWSTIGGFQDGYSMIWGFASDVVKSIVITSENSIQPNKIKINDELWLWYQTINRDQINMPVTINAFDGEGNKIYGKNP